MINYLIKDVIAVLRYLPYGLVAGIVVAIILSAVNDRRMRRKKKTISVAAVTSFFMYVVIILFITFLSRESGSRVGLDLSLLSTWGINDRNNAYVIENVLLFIPYGFVSAWAIHPARRIWFCTLWGFLSSLAIECMQLLTGRGYFQLDDILTNAIGTVIGYILFRCILHEERTSGQKTKLVYLILAVLLMLATVLGIIAFSSESAAESNSLSTGAAAFLVNMVDKWLNMDLQEREYWIIVSFVNPVLRKLAHASEYAALAIVIGFGYQMMKRNRAKVVNYFYAVILCGLIALADEMLQKYVFFRTGRLADVAIDVCGAIMGGCFYVFLSELFEFLSGEE